MNRWFQIITRDTCWLYTHYEDLEEKKRETFENRLVCSPKLSCADIILVFSGPLSPVQIAITFQITEQHPRTTQLFSAHHSQSRVAAFECMLSERAITSKQKYNPFFSVYVLSCTRLVHKF